MSNEGLKIEGIDEDIHLPAMWNGDSHGDILPLKPVSPLPTSITARFVLTEPTSSPRYLDIIAKALNLADRFKLGSSMNKKEQIPLAQFRAAQQKYKRYLR